MNKKEYNKYHKNTTVQKKLISKNNFTYRIIASVVNNYLSENQQILDIGCGAGTLAFYMADKHNQVLGIDISKQAIKKCKESARILHLPSLSFEIMDFPKETPTKRFDLITCTEVLEHLGDDKLAVAQIYKLLKKGGVAIISTPSQHAPLYRLGLTKKFDKQVGHVRRYTLADLQAECQTVGFDVIETRLTEGIIRNLLFINPIAGKLIRFIRFGLTDLVSFIDAISCKLFGESDIFIVIRKPL